MFEHAPLRLRIDGREWVVEHDDGACMCERPRKSQPRLLAARERPPVRKDFRFKRECPALDVLPEFRFLQERQDIDIPAERDIFRQRRMQKFRRMAHPRHEAAQLSCLH